MNLFIMFMDKCIQRYYVLIRFSIVHRRECVKSPMVNFEHICVYNFQCRGEDNFIRNNIYILYAFERAF